MIDVLEKEEQRILANLERLLTRSNETITRVEKTKTELDEIKEKVHALKDEERILIVHTAELKSEASNLSNIITTLQEQKATHTDLSQENTQLQESNSNLKAENMQYIQDISLLKIQKTVLAQEHSDILFTTDEARLVLTELQDKVNKAEKEEKKTNGHFIGQLQRLLDDNKIKFDVLKHLQ
jgi:myosin heavy subunit